MAKKKVAVIGSGIAGSGIAALLAQTGEYEVDLYERNRLIGGRYASHVKEGFRLDIGCHMVANGPNGTMHEILRILGQPEAVRWRTVKMEDSIFNYRGKGLMFPNEIDRMGFTGDEIQKIMQFYVETISIPEDKYEEYDRISLLEQLEKYIKDDRARTLFGYLASLYFVTYDFETPLGEWARCSKEMMLHQTGGYPIGGTGAIPEAYVRVMEQYGGRMHLGTPVKRIIIEDRTATGVELKDGTVRRSDMVVSNVGLKPTVDMFVGRGHYGEEFLTRVDRYEYSSSWGVIKVALDTVFVEKTPFVLYMGSDNLATKGKTLESGVIPDAMEFMMVPIVSNLDPSACPEGRQLILAGAVAGRPRHSRPADRERWKAAFLKGVETLFPGITEHVMWAEYTSTTDIDNLFGEDGNVIGIAQKLGQVGEDRPPIEDPEIKNLYHCSADSGLHGIGGELAADSALRLYTMLVG